MSDLGFFRKQFVNYIRLEKALSENTVQNYIFDIEKFMDFLENKQEINEIKNVTDKVVEKYIFYLRNLQTKRGGYYSAKSVNRHISSLKPFLS